MKRLRNTRDKTFELQNRTRRSKKANNGQTNLEISKFKNSKY